MRQLGDRNNKNSMIGGAKMCNRGLQRRMLICCSPEKTPL